MVDMVLKINIMFVYNFVFYLYMVFEVGKCVFVDCVEYLGDLDFFDVL